MHACLYISKRNTNSSCLKVLKNVGFLIIQEWWGHQIRRPLSLKRQFIIHCSQAGLHRGQSGGRRSRRKNGSQPSLLFPGKGQDAGAQAGLELPGMNYFSGPRSSLQHPWLPKESYVECKNLYQKKKKKSIYSMSLFIENFREGKLIYSDWRQISGCLGAGGGSNRRERLGELRERDG